MTNQPMSVKYQLVPGYMGQPPSVVLDIVNQIWIPFDPDNTSYQQYLAWLAEGNEPLPADEPPAG